MEMSEEKKNEIISNDESNINYQAKLIKDKNNPLILNLESKDNKLIISITDPDAIGNGLYKNELTKEELNKINSSFKTFETINETIQILKTVCTKDYTIKFSENFDTLTYSFNAINFDQKQSYEFLLKRIPMNDKEIINQLCEKVKILNTQLKKYEEENDDEEDILQKLNSKIFLNDDEYNMINEHIIFIERIKSKKTKWTKIFNSSEDGDSAETFHQKCDNIEGTVILIKTKKYKRFGGYAKKKWNHSNGSFANDSKAFLFSLTTMDIFNRNENGNEIKGDKDSGPWFGSGPDFQIVNKWFSNNSTHNKKCFSYPQNVNFPLAENNNFLVKELEVYKIEFE